MSANFYGFPGKGGKSPFQALEEARQKALAQKRVMELMGPSPLPNTPLPSPKPEYQIQPPAGPNMAPPMTGQPIEVGPAPGDGLPGMNQAPAPNPYNEVGPENAGSTVSGTPQPTSDKETWDATGKTDTFGSFFNKRAGTDALTAFGAAMLKAPTFSEGLGNAALAVNLVDRENRMPTQQEIARANIKWRMNNGGGATAWKTLQQGYDQNGGNWTQIMSPTGEIQWNGPNGEKTNKPPQGFMDRANSGMGKWSNLNATAVEKLYNDADLAGKQIEDYNKMETLIGGANTGPGAIEKMSRFITSATGVDFGGTNLADNQQFQKMAKDGELLKAMEQRGLGQFTEMERKIVQEALVTVDTDPEAARRILSVMRARAQRNIDMADDWNASGLSPNQFRSWQRDWMKDWKEKNGSIYNTAKQTDKKSEAPSAPSIIDEADAIVNGQ